MVTEFQTFGSAVNDVREKLTHEVDGSLAGGTYICAWPLSPDALNSSSLTKILTDLLLLFCTCRLVEVCVPGFAARSTATGVVVNIEPVLDAALAVRTVPIRTEAISNPTPPAIKAGLTNRRSMRYIIL